MEIIDEMGNNIVAIMPYQQALFDRINDPNFKETKICIARTPGKSISFYDVFIQARRSGRTEFTRVWLDDCIKIAKEISDEKIRGQESFMSQYYIDPELMAEFDAKNLINEMENNNVINKRRNQKQSSWAHRRGNPNFSRSKLKS